MITRIWHGYTTFDNANAYQNLLLTKIFPEIAAKNVAGYRQIQLLKRPLPGEVEFITIMWFETWQDIINFAGEDYEKSVVPPEAGALLERFDAKSQHYTMIATLEYERF